MLLYIVRYFIATAAILCVFHSPPPAAAAETETRVSSEVKARVLDKFEKLKQNEAAAFHPSLIFLEGVPTLMVVTDRDEGLAKGKARRELIYSQLRYLLHENSFESVRISVVYSATIADGNNPAKKRKEILVANHEIERNRFLEATTRVTEVALTGASESQRQKVDDKAEALCTELGIQ